MRTTTAVIVGAGQAGLAMSRCLTERAIDHVLLEQGEVANAWGDGGIRSACSLRTGRPACPATATAATTQMGT